MADTPRVTVPVDELAQEIRRVDGNHDLGAGALAEALMPFLSSRLSAAPAPEGGAVDLHAIAKDAAERVHKNGGCVPQIAFAPILFALQAALAAREEAPAEAGERSGGQIAFDAWNGTDGDPYWLLESDAWRQRWERVAVALRAQPPARENAQPVDAAWHYTKDCPAPEALREAGEAIVERVKSGASGTTVQALGALSDIEQIARAALASGSGDHSGGVNDMIDHAELARDLRRADEYQPLGHDGWKAADALEALLTEIAALRASDMRTGELLAESNLRESRATVRATEAERKLAEAVGLLGEALNEMDRRVITAETANRIDYFLSKEAERG